MTKELKLAPIILFVYNRPIHTKQTLDALAKNTLAQQSDLYIFSDGPKNETHQKLIAEVHKIIHSETYKQAFNSMHIELSETNKGLAKNIITGVSEILEAHGSVIVLEDDLVTSSDFLSFMNECLSFYESNTSVGCISGYSPIADSSFISEDVYFTNRNCSIGWATWKNIWSAVDWELTDYKEFRTSRSKRNIFNRYGIDRSLRIDNHMKGKTHSWSIRFGYSLVKHNLFTVYPKISRLKHIGWDGTGTNTSKANKAYEKFNSLLVSSDNCILVSDVRENPKVRNRFLELYSGTGINRIKLYIKELVRTYV